MRVSLRPFPVASSLVFSLLLSAPPAGAAGGFRKPYFRATVPGAFARTRSVNTVNGDVSEYFYARRADEDGKVVFETRYELQTGKFAGTKGMNRSVMRAGFPLETEGLSFARWTEKSQASSPDGQVVDFPEETVKAIAAGATDYGAIVVFRGTETVDGKACDHYAYSHGAGDQKVEGEYWLSEKVPFAVVKEVTSGTDATGARYRYETKLVESGVKPELAKGGRKAPAAAAARTLAELYAAGKVSILVEVSPQSPRASLTVTNSGEEAVQLVVPKGTTTLACGSPVGDLVLVSEEERKLSIAGGEAAPSFGLAMKGARRPTSGSFTVSVYGGEPLFSGSVEIDTVKK